MPKLRSKDRLIKAIEWERAELHNGFQRISDGAMIQPSVCQAWSVKDILAHLRNCHCEALKGLKQSKI